MQPNSASNSASPALSLVIMNQLHPFPFCQQEVEVIVGLWSMTERRLVRPVNDLPISVCLRDNIEVVDGSSTGSVEVMNPSALFVSAATGTSPQLRVMMPSQCTPSTREVVLVVEAAFGEIREVVAPYRSVPLRIIRHRLEICNEEEIKRVVFTDKGGKIKNTIKLDVRLRDHENNTVARRGVRLKYVLILDDNEVVAEQDLLRVDAKKSDWYINDDGHAIVHCLLLRVSSKFKLNNRKRAFKIMVVPGISEHECSDDISGCCSPGIWVLSKPEESPAKRAQKAKKSDQQRHNVKTPDAVLGNKRKCDEVISHVRSISPSNAPAVMLDESIQKLKLAKREFEVNGVSPLTAMEEVLACHERIGSFGSMMSVTSTSHMHPVTFDEGRHLTKIVDAVDHVSAGPWLRDVESTLGDVPSREVSIGCLVDLMIDHIA